MTRPKDQITISDLDSWINFFMATRIPFMLK